MISGHRNRGLVRRIALLALLWCAGLYLRIPILVAPALAPAIGDELGLGPTTIGALTTLPVLMLAAGAVAGSLVVARLGPRTALALALAVTAAASAARGLAPPAALLLAATAITGLGIAVMQPALPALVARWCPGFTALAVAVYMNGMLLGEFVGAGLTLPVAMPLAGGDWRVALLLWSLPALAVAAALYLPRAPTPDPGGGGAAWQPAWRDPRLWRLGLLLGAASVVFFGTNAYMAEVLAARGEAARLPRSLWWFNLSQAVASLCMLGLARHLVARRAPLAVTAVAAPAGLLGFLLLSGDAALAAGFVLGFASAAQLILLVALVPHLAPGQAGRLSAGMFAIGYAVAFAVPLLGGLLSELEGRAAVALLPTLLYAAAAALLVPGLSMDRRQPDQSP